MTVPGPARRRRTRWKRSPLSASARGYDHQHRKLRAALIAQWVPGDPCARCGQPMWGPPSKIHLGHTDDRTAWTGLEHERCNIRDAAVRGAIRSNASKTAAARTATVPRSRQW
jgi:hypothetical protein